ncbi:ABC transporter permease [Sutterella sp.]|uniref:ABC transporter permease n=1 Tax=Sutterella sp. TaxID=1981025 RepID=UPI0026DFF3CC|nr:ABC transporter permease [Sutterella sp.]MDO5532469.1 ABC transporter permease [Sutterella sp.]
MFAKIAALLHALRLSLVRLRALARKELVTLLRDPAMRRILVVPIIAQSVLFGYGATFNLEEAPYVILDASRSPASEAVIRRMESNRIFRRAADPRSHTDFIAALSDGRALIGLWFPEDFADRMARGETAEIFVATDARNTTTANVATGYVSQIIEDVNRGNGTAGVIEIRERYRFNENGITRYNIMTGLILGLAMIQVMLLAGLAVSREREEGSFDMMLMTPLSPVEIFIGKAVAPIVIGIAQSLMIFSVCRWWFEIPFAGSIWLLIFVVTLFSTSIVGLALAISAWARTLLESVVISFVLLLPSFVLSGLMTPAAAMPEWMQTVTIMNPVRYGILTIRMIYFENAGLADILPYLWPLAVIALVTIPGAAWLFRHKVT